MASTGCPSRTEFETFDWGASLVVVGVSPDFRSNFPGISIGSVIFWSEPCRERTLFFRFPVDEVDESV